VGGRDEASLAGEPSLSHIARTQALTALPTRPGGTARDGIELLMPQRPRRCESLTSILVHSIAEEPKQEISHGTAKRGRQQQVLGSALRSGHFS